MGFARLGLVLAIAVGVVLGACTNLLGIGQPGEAVVDPAQTTVTVDRAGGVVADGEDAVTVTITVRDATGQPMVGRAVAVAATPVSGSDITQPAVTDAAGMATATLTSTRAESKQIIATIDGISAEEQPTVAFVAGPAAALRFLVPPGNAVAGAAIAPAVQVRIDDANGNPVLDGADAITLAIGTNPASGALTGTTVVTAVDGIASFDDLVIDRPGAGYTLTATATDRTAATSVGFAVTLGPGARLGFLDDPGSTVAGVAIAPAIRVAIQDGVGNTITTATDDVTVAIGNHAGAGTLSGTLTVAAVAGVATFSGLSIELTGVGYTLVATATGYTGDEGAPFTITPAAPSAAVSTVVASPAIDVIANGTAASTITVTVKDALGNAVPGQGVTLAALPVTGNTLSPAGSVSTDAAGVATWTLRSTKAETKTITATVGGALTLTQQPTVVFIAGPVSATVSTVTTVVTATGLPGNVVANGVATSTITVTALDANANPVSGQAVVLTIGGTANTFAQPGNTSGAGVTSTTLASTKAEAKTIAATPAASR